MKTKGKKFPFSEHIVCKRTTNMEEKGINGKVSSKVCGAMSADTLGRSNVINSREGKIFGVKTLPIPALLFELKVFN